MNLVREFTKKIMVYLLSEIVGASIVKASDPLAVFYEPTLSRINKKAQREHGVVKEFDLII